MKNNLLTADIVSVHNLCPDPERPGTFMPVGQPKPVAPEGYAILANLPDGQVVVSNPDGTSVLNPDTGAIAPIDTARGISAATIGPDSLLVMTEAGPTVFERTDNGDLIPASKERELWNPISIVAEQMAPMSLVFNPINLAAPLPQGSEIPSAVQTHILDSVADDYRRFCARADRQGVFFQPVLARAVVLDADGNLLFRTPPVLVKPLSGNGFDGFLRLDMADDVTTEESVVQLPTFRLRVVTHPMNDQTLVGRAARLRVEVTPAFHPLAVKSVAATGFVNRGSSSRGVVLNVNMDGAEEALSANDATRSLENVKRMMTVFDRAKFTLGTVDLPYDREADKVLSTHALPPLETRLSTLDKARESSPRRSTTCDRLNVPHSFVAASIESTPTTMAYADLTSILYPGYSPADYAYAVADDNRAWRAVTTVVYNDGRTSARLSRGFGKRPLSLNPLVCYPDPDATGLEMAVEDSDKNVYVWSVRLTAHPEAGCAFGLSENLSELPGTAFASSLFDRFSADSPVTVPMRSFVAVARANDSLRVVSALNLGAAPTALVAASSTTAAWDFGRTRFYCFTDDNVFLINVSDSTGTIATSPLASVGVRNRGSVTVTDNRQTFFTGKDGFVYGFNGPRLTVLAKLPVGVNRIGYDPTDRRLVAGDISGSTDLYHLDIDSGRVVMTSTLPAPFDVLWTVRDHLLMPSQSGMSDIALGRRVFPQEASDIRLACRFVTAPSFRPAAFSSLTLDIDSEHFDGRAEIENMSTAGRTAAVTSLAFAGRVASPLTVPLVFRPVRALALKLTGKVHPETRIASPVIRTL